MSYGHFAQEFIKMDNQETLDWLKLAVDIIPRNDKIPYGPNKQFFTKVAFDVFQFTGSPVESLWILEEGEDGKQYLVARYDEDAQPLEVKSNWLALPDKECKNITLAYKNVPIQKFAASEFGFTQADAYIFQRTLIEKLSSDKSFVEKLLKSQPKEKQEKLLTQFPELV